MENQSKNMENNLNKTTIYCPTIQNNKLSNI